MSVRLVVDSTADIPEGMRSRLTVIPLSIFFGDEEYLDGVTIDHRRFYEKLIESDLLPTTSQAAPDAFIRIFEEAKSVGDQVVVLTISSKLSGTYQSALIAAEDYSQTAYVVDSQSVAIGAGILAQLALSWIEEGVPANVVAENLAKERDRVRVIAMLDTLEYLKRGGRISKTVAFAGGILSIKPVVSLRDGEVQILGKARGSRQGNNLLVQEIQAAGGVDFSKPLLLGYTGIHDDLLQKYIQDSAYLWEGNLERLQIAAIGSAVGTHVGPGAVAAAFFVK